MRSTRFRIASPLLFLLLLMSRAAFGVEINLDCANNTADTARLNKGISESHVGDQIRIHGTCLINRTVVLLSDRSYLGDSRTGTIIRQADHANLDALVASDSWVSNSPYTDDPIRLADLTLDGNSAANSNTNVLVIRSWLTVLEDLLIENAPEDGVRISAPSMNGTQLQGSQVNGRMSNLFVTNSGANGIHEVDSSGVGVTDWDLLDSWIAYSGENGIYLETSAGWKIRGNHIYGVKRNALWANQSWATTIDANYIEDFGGAGGNEAWYGILCTVGGGAASVISNNRVFMLQPEEGTGQHVYIGVPQVNYGVGQVNVVGNVILGSGSALDVGLNYQINGGKGLEVLSSGNNVQGVHTARILGAGAKLVEGY